MRDDLIPVSEPQSRADILSRAAALKAKLRGPERCVIQVAPAPELPPPAKTIEIKPEPRKRKQLLAVGPDRLVMIAKDRTHDEIIEAVARRYRCCPRALRNKGKMGVYRLARQLAYALVKHAPLYRDLPLTEMGQIFSGRDHTTLLHYLKKYPAAAKFIPAKPARVVTPISMICECAKLRLAGLSTYKISQRTGLDPSVISNRMRVLARYPDDEKTIAVASMIGMDPVEMCERLINVRKDVIHRSKPVGSKRSASVGGCAPGVSPVSEPDGGCTFAPVDPARSTTLRGLPRVSSLTQPRPVSKPHAVGAFSSEAAQ